MSHLRAANWRLFPSRTWSVVAKVYSRHSRWHSSQRVHINELLPTSCLFCPPTSRFRAKGTSLKFQCWPSRRWVTMSQKLSTSNDCLGDFPLHNGVGFRHNLVLTQSVKLRGMTHPELWQEAKVR